MANLGLRMRTVATKFRDSYLGTRRFLNYTALCYDDKDPAALFFNNDIQQLLRSLTRVDYNKVFRRRKLGASQLEDPEYKFMTDAELQQSLQEAKEKAEELLQIPPVLKVLNSEVKVLNHEPALQGLNTSRIVFTDITYGVKDSDRLIVVREPDGVLQEAEWDLRQRINQMYFPKEGKLLNHPQIFEGEHLQSLLDRHKYEYVLDRACLQFEPDDPFYQRVVSIVYQHLNESNSFDLLRSSRHFGALTFFLVWNKMIDNLLLDLIETLHINEAKDLVTLYGLVHQVKFNGEEALDVVEDFIRTAANKKGALELAIQAYKDVPSQRESRRGRFQVVHELIE
ncbi:small ribosomal subunit protein mS22 [Euwallacea fornicatus]|uniref:small ribosomal subunit protein mS22 n=1 Tax=Euwallacea fornicatus TaxID=995702 RepID=UPI0033901273